MPLCRIPTLQSACMADGSQAVSLAVRPPIELLGPAVSLQLRHRITSGTLFLLAFLLRCSIIIDEIY